MNFFIMGFPAALDFVEGSGRAFEMGMICNHYIGRTFIQPSQPMRDFGVRAKLHPVRAVPESKKCWSCRGFHYPRQTSRYRVKNLRSIGIKELHMAVNYPPTVYPCPYGIDFSSKGELITAKKKTKKPRPISSAWIPFTPFPWTAGSGPPV